LIALVRAGKWETVSIEPLGYGYFTARRLNEEEVRRIFETARWAAIGKALWHHLETQGMTLTLETKRRRGYIPLVLDGVEFGYWPAGSRRRREQQRRRQTAMTPPLVKLIVGFSVSRRGSLSVDREGAFFSLGRIERKSPRYPFDHTDIIET